MYISRSFSSKNLPLIRPRTMSRDTSDISTKAPTVALPFSLDYLPEELKIRAKVELSENENETEHKLKLLKSLLKEEKNLRWQDDDMFLLAFLRARKFDVKRACDLVRGFYTTLGRHGHLYYTLNFDFGKKVMEENSFGFLPYRDRDGAIVLFFHFSNWDFNAITAEEHLVCVTLGLLQALLSLPTQIAGVKIIADFKDLTASHLLHVPPSSVLFFLRMLQNVIPIRMQGLHVVNENHLFSYFWSFGKMFISKKFKERIQMHGNDLESLHKFFNPSILPADLGGDQPPYDNSSWCERMEKSSDYIEHVVSFGYQKYLTKYKSSKESNEISERHER